MAYTSEKDDEAFFTWRPYHYVVLADVQFGDKLPIVVANVDGTVKNTLQGKVRAMFYREVRMHRILSLSYSTAPPVARGFCMESDTGKY